MFKERLKSLTDKFASRLKNTRLPQFNLLKGMVFFLKSWWQILVLAIAAVIFLYYPLGGWYIENIDTRTDYEIDASHPEQSSTVEMMSFIINREVNDKLWTPNLPFFFPSYFLDNMPSFQQGMIKAVSNMSLAFSRRLSPRIIDKAHPGSLKEAAELLQYPGTIWMFSPDNKLVPAPSSTRQYRKARRRLIRYNEALAAGVETFYRNPQDLSYFLKRGESGLRRSSEDLESRIREYSSSWYDGKADDTFYYNQGKAYGYYLLFKALGHDYQDIIVSSGEYENWTRMLKSLEEAAEISPLMIRNGMLDSSFAPNHLAYLNASIQKAQNLLLKIAARLPVNNKDK